MQHLDRDLTAQDQLGGAPWGAPTTSLYQAAESEEDGGGEDGSNGSVEEINSEKEE